MNPPTSAGQTRIRFRDLLRFGGGGWVLWLAALLCLVVVFWRGSVIVSQLGRGAVGDGVRPESYGFDLSNLTVPRDTLVGAGYARDGIPALTEPPKLTVAEADEFHRYMRKEHRHKFVVASDMVIGVERSGEAVAYPTRLLAWHQVVNDTVGGQPLLITYDPLCDSSAVFERALAGTPREFGVSGILYNSNLVFYDRQPNHNGESLWSQLQFAAIAGPQAGQSLELVPFSAMPWSEWVDRHPQTRIIRLDENRVRVYKSTFGEYYGSDKLRFPVHPLPDDSVPRKTRTWAWRSGDGWRHVRIDQVLPRLDSNGQWQLRAGQHVLSFRANSSRELVWLETAGGAGSESAAAASLPVVEAFWFAWFSQHPDSRPFDATE